MRKRIEKRKEEIFSTDNLKQYDFWWNDKAYLPQTWYEGAFLGNGTLGAMLYFRQEGERRYLHIELGSKEVYDRRESREFWMAKQFDNCRLPIGYLEYECSGKILEYYMHVSLSDATAVVFLKTESQGRTSLLHCECFVCAQNSMIVLKQLSGSIDNWIFTSREAVSPRQLYGKLQQQSERIDPNYVENEKPEISHKDEKIICIQRLADNYRTVTICEVRKQENKIFISIDQDQNLTARKAEESLANCISDDYEKKHLEWWTDYYRISGLKIPAKDLEEFYWRQIYKLGCVIREESRVLDNQGPWLFTTPWPGTWWNLNVQLCYWPLYTSGRLAQANSLNKFLDRYREDLKENVPEEYREDSLGIGTNTTWNLKSRIADPGKDNGKQFVELGNLTWALHDCWLYYQMTLDKEMLREILFPLLKGSINYYLHFVKKGPDQKWHLPATSSPEYGELCEDCNYDLALLKWGCQTLLECTEILHIRDEKASIWKDIVINLTDFPKDETGYLIGKNLPYAKTHRHFSHLLMHVPLELINRDNSDTKELIERSVKHWFSYEGDIMGFSYVGASLLYSSYQMGDESVRFLYKLLERHITPNTMYQEAGPVMETPLSAAECIQQLLLQSWGGKIRIFPALPSAWHEAEFYDFCAQGGFRVSASYAGDKVQWIQVKSLSNTICILETTMKQAALIRENGTVQNLVIDGTCKIPMSEGEEIVLINRI